MCRLAFGELLQGCDITANKRFLLGATPSLEPSFAFDGIRDAIEPFRKHQFDRPARRRISRKRSGVVLGNSCLKRRPRRADIQAAIATSNDDPEELAKASVSKDEATCGLAAILRDAAKTPLLRMRLRIASHSLRMRSSKRSSARLNSVAHGAEARKCLRPFVARGASNDPQRVGAAES